MKNYYSLALVWSMLLVITVSCNQGGMDAKDKATESSEDVIVVASPLVEGYSVPVKVLPNLPSRTSCAAVLFSLMTIRCRQ